MNVAWFDAGVVVLLESVAVTDTEYWVAAARPVTTAVVVGTVTTTVLVVPTAFTVKV